MSLLCARTRTLLSLLHPQALTTYKSWTVHITSSTHPCSMNYTASCYLQPMLKHHYVMVTHLELYICMNCKLVFQKLYSYTYALTIYVFRRILPGFHILYFTFSLLLHWIVGVLSPYKFAGNCSWYNRLIIFFRVKI